MGVPVGVESVVIIPVIRPPGVPVSRPVTPIPGRAPGDVPRGEDEPDQRPGSYLHVGGSDDFHPLTPLSPAGIAGVGGLPILIVVDRFDDVIPAVEVFVANQLNGHGTIVITFNGEDGHILVFAVIEGHPQHDVVDLAIGVVGDGDVVNQSVPIQVEVVDSGVLAVQVTFKLFQGFRFLEEIHDGIQVKVISGQPEVFRLSLLSSVSGSCRGDDRQEQCSDYSFHLSGIW